MSDVEGLRTVLAHVTEHQDEWRQDAWTDCFAGQTMRLLAGATNSGSCPCCGGLTVDGETFYGDHIGVKAAELLDLTAHQAVRLFHADNSLGDLTRLVQEFIEEATRQELALTA
jgi:hypothetical protein